MSVRRDATPYAERRSGPMVVVGAVSVSAPVAGFYKVKFGRDTILRAVRLFNGPPRDPVTGEELDRSHRWQAELDDGVLADFDQIWPACARNPIPEAEWLRCKGRIEWARQHAPDSAYAGEGRKYDPLSTSQPLPF